VKSLRDDPIRLREPKYVRKPEDQLESRPRERRIDLIVNQEHYIHHV
jgi:hypothetical protein